MRFLTLLSLISLTVSLAQAEYTTLQPITRTVQHHHHVPTGSIAPRTTIVLKRDDASESAVTASSLPTLSTTMTSPTPSITSTIGSSTTGMPKILIASTAQTSTSLSHTIYIPSSNNPFVNKETLPAGLTFIAVGAALGFILVIMILVRLINRWRSQRQAKKTSLETQQALYHYDQSIFSKGPSSGAGGAGNGSVYSFGSNSTVDILHKQQSMEQLLSSGGNSQGKSYRNAVTNSSRASMFISPTELIAQHPALQQHGFIDQYDSPIASPQHAYGSNHSMNLRDDSDYAGEKKNDEQKRMKRPPSVYMEQLLNDDSDDTSSVEYLYTNEKFL